MAGNGIVWKIGESGNQTRSGRRFRARSTVSCEHLQFSGSLFTISDQGSLHWPHGAKRRAFGEQICSAIVYPSTFTSYPLLRYALSGWRFLTTDTQVTFLLTVDAATVSLPVEIQFF